MKTILAEKLQPLTTAEVRWHKKKMYKIEKKDYMWGIKNTRLKMKRKIQKDINDVVQKNEEQSRKGKHSRQIKKLKAE